MIVDFLKTKRSTKDLKACLETLLEFKECEGREEWEAIPFAAWTKLEQLEEFLECLVHGKPPKPDTMKAIARAGEKNAKPKS